MEIPVKFADMIPDLETERGRAQIRILLKMIEAREGASNAMTRICWAALAEMAGMDVLG